MRAKPDMKPWVSTDKSKMSSLRSGTNSASIGALAWDCAAPMGLKEYVSMPNPGLAPWAMQEYRPKGLFYDKFKINVSTSYLFQ